MSAIDTVLQWLGSGSALLWWLGIAVKSAAVAAVGLLIARLITSARPDIRNLVLRPVVLLAGILPVITVIAGAVGFPGSQAEPSGWLIPLPAVSAGLLGDPVGSSGLGANRPVGGMLILMVLAGSILASVRIGFGVYLARKAARISSPEPDETTTDLIDRICEQTRRRRRVRVAFSRMTAVPFATGIFSHVVVLPEAARRWKCQEIEIVLRHELLHIDRHDNLWAFIASLATALHWFNPLVWMARRQLVLEAEKSCDAGVLSAGIGASEYAKLLITLARSARGRTTKVAFSSPILGMKLLEVRIMSILQTRVRSLRIPGPLRWSVLVFTIALLVPLTALRLAGADGTGSKSGAAGSKLEAAADSTNWPSPDEFIAVDVQPERLTSPGPVYPDSARKAGLEGSTWVKVLVDTTGTVATAQVMKTSTHKILDDAALESAWKTTFKPAERGGKKLRVWVSYEIKFKLKQK